MFEDEKTNRLIDSFNEWEKVMKRKEFKDSAVIVFLNKMDLLHKKFIVDKIPIKDEYVLNGLRSAPVRFCPRLLFCLVY